MCVAYPGPAAGASSASRRTPAAAVAPRRLFAGLLDRVSALYAGQAAAQDTTGAQAPASGDAFAGQDAAAGDTSPTRVTLAHEATYKVAEPERFMKNRASVQLEYSRYFFDRFFVQFRGRSTAFLNKDHRHDTEGSDTQVSQAYVQTSWGQTSVRAGVQALPWGESILAAVTDEVSPRDNRELFNFNLEELRLGQGMIVIDRYSAAGRWSAFWIPDPVFNKNPEKGSAYYFDPLAYRSRIEGDGGAEYGASWRKTFESADITFMAASLLDNDYARRMNGDGTASRVKERFSMAGMSFTYAISNFVIRGEAAFKSPKTYNDPALQIVKKKAIDTYLGVDYRYSSSLLLSVEATNQRIAGWTGEIAGLPRDRVSVLFSATKTMMNEDLSMNLLHFRNMPYRGNLSMLVNTLKWDDHLTFGLNLIYPEAPDQRNGLWSVRDQKQVAFRVQYQF
jgi:hypothetical protein